MESKIVHYKVDQVEWNEEFYDLNYNAPENFCHANSLRLHINFNLELSSGFSVRTSNLFDNYKYCELHSFNLIENRVIDYTYFKNKDPLISKGLKLPCEYLGVTIPDRFIKELTNQVIIPIFGGVNNPGIGNFFPLIVPFFYFERGDNNWIKCFE